MFWINFKNQTNREYGIEVTTRPNIPAPVMRGEYVEVAGRDGSLLVTDGTYENIEISVSMNFVKRRNHLNDQYRRAKAWLQGSGELKFSDDLGAFFKVKSAAISDYQRAAKNGSKFNALFVCDPYTYLEAGQVPVGAGAIVNPYALAKPIYKLTGEGKFTLTVNGNKLTGDIGQNMTIDTDKMLVYREDGSLANSATTGDLDTLWLPNGENEITITGGALEVIPNWRTL